MMTIDVPEAYSRALDAFGALVHRVGPGQWENPTPCVDWDVRALVNHVVGENLWAPELLAGRSSAEVGGAFDGDLLGDDPIKAFDTSAVAAVQAVTAPRALEGVVRLPFGDVPGREYVTELFADALIHTWDLARAIGADERLDPELVDACSAWFPPAEPGPRRETPGDGSGPSSPEDAQTHLLASWGRHT